MYMEVKGHYRNNRDIARGVLEEREIKLINRVFELEKMKLTGLQNLRDFIVAITNKSSSPIDWDLMSAITYLIDKRKIELGGSV